MLNQKPINILVSYIKTPSMNGFRQLAEQTLAQMHSEQVGLLNTIFPMYLKWHAR